MTLIKMDTDSYGYSYDLAAGQDIGVETEFHSRQVALSDGNTYSVELEMTLEHR
jgi:hypothetical protein